MGAGTGVTFALYPETITEVVALEPERRLRQLAAEAAQTSAVPVSVLDGVADAVQAPDASFDAIVVSLVLCSVPDQATALAELRRVLRPGGELRFFEHVIARNRIKAAVLRGLEATIWPRLAGGCHPARDTGRAIESAGFTMRWCERLGPAPRQPPLPFILGAATKPQKASED